MNILQGEDNVISENAHGTCTEHMNTYQKYVTTDFQRTPTDDKKHHKIRYKNCAKAQVLITGKQVKKGGGGVEMM